MVDLPTHFWDRVEVTGCCWLWQGTIKNDSGYGVIGIDYKKYYVHRLVYEALVGPIPDGMHIDHICRIRHCVNPDHLEPVTLAENVLRGYSAGARAKRENVCVRGHQLTEDTVWVTKTGARKCKQCSYITNTRWYAFQSSEW